MRLSELGREGGVVAHFVAHTGPNVNVAALAFNPRWAGSQQRGGPATALALLCMLGAFCKFAQFMICIAHFVNS